MDEKELPPAGWYPCPSGRPRRRWWDGARWTKDYDPPPRMSGLKLFLIIFAAVWIVVAIAASQH